ncbi:hypothetical protein AKJ64_01590 [candidate division MSBL1 archaeon SCGC-AAA259E17]|uniref:Uncharacterized protein n=1 Tax=candidate division MSBL1 archaeon SCGC-AAA259E17 TaxID=1698263 RepID=A0A133UFN1_9EURY|nr:hypothetical protein AKJ64_01590 [candidate division MSBL1 archaeon SCGC-AAA259E17]
MGFGAALGVALGEDAGETVRIADAEDISGGVTAELACYDRWTLLIHVAGAIDVTVELSPDGKATWYEIDESPYSYGAAGDSTNELGYDATHIRLTGSNATSVTAQIRGVW